MIKSAIAVLVAATALLTGITAGAQGSEAAPYKNTGLSARERAIDLVHRMTLAEKASQLVNQARAIPRLGVPAYDWWSESLHGVAVNGTTEFPEPIGLAATFGHACHQRNGHRDCHRRAYQARPGRAGRSLEHFRGSGFLGSQRQHLSRSTLGTRPGNVWRRPIPYGAHGGLPS